MDELSRIGFSYIFPHRVAGMAEPWARHLAPTLDLLARRGVGAVLTLTEEDPLGPWYEQAGLLHGHVPMDDGEAPEPEAVDRALAFMDQALARGLGVAVHCLEGRGRTGVVLAAWLAGAEAENLDFERVLARLRAARPLTAINRSQKAFLETYIRSRFPKGGLAGPFPSSLAAVPRP
ncbi:MAG: dual specificity protein phosphatase family protein [Pseudomonadota bacterium]